MSVAASRIAQVLYVTSGEQDLADEVRVPHDNNTIGYDRGQRMTAAKGN